MYHICQLPDISIKSVKEKLPQLIKQVETEKAENLEIIQKLQQEEATDKIELEQQRLEKLAVTRNNKINEVLGTGNAFKNAASESVIEKLVLAIKEAS